MPLLQTENLTIHTSPGNPASQVTILLDMVNLSIEENAITSLIGKSGAGKTIFARAISGLLPPGVVIGSGNIFYRGRQIDYAGLTQMRGREILYLPQNASASLNPVYKIKQQVFETSRISLDETLKIMEILDFKPGEIDRILSSYPFQLSGGQNQRCLLAMAIAIRPRLLILDEPTSSLHDDARQNVIDLVERIRDLYGLTILLISHDLNMVKNISGNIYTISGGQNPF